MMIIEVILTDNEVNTLRENEYVSTNYLNVKNSIMQQIRDGINANPHY